MNQAKVVHDIIRHLGIDGDDSLLEVGRGAGYLAELFLSKGQIAWEGCDLSRTLVQKCVEFHKCDADVAGAAALPYIDKSINYVYAFSIYHYFPDLEYVATAIQGA